MQDELERLIQVTGLKNDPVLPLIKVLSSSLRLQWRLHNQAVRYFHDASDRLDREYHDTIKKTELAIQQAEAVLQTKQAGIVEQLTPKLAGTINYAVHQQAKTVKYKTIGVWWAMVLAIACVPLHLRGRAQCRAFPGEIASHLISVAMRAGPAEAIAWGAIDAGQ